MYLLCVKIETESGTETHYQTYEKFPLAGDAARQWSSAGKNPGVTVITEIHDTSLLEYKTMEDFPGIPLGILAKVLKGLA